MAVRKRRWRTKTGELREAWALDYADARGVRRQETFARKKDAVARLNQIKVDLKRGQHVPESASITVAEAAGQWLKMCNAAGLEGSTLMQYRQHVDLHVIPLIGRVKLSQLSVPTVRQFQDRLRAEGRSAAMIKRVTVSLGSIIAEAQDRGLANHNAVREMGKRRSNGKLRQAERRRKAKLQVGVDIPAPDEIRRIIEHTKGRWRPLIITAAFSGLRASELRGLRWQDIDLKESRIHVRQRADRFNQIGPPKTAAARRTIPIGPYLVNSLKQWKVACPKGDLVFPNGNGAVEYLQNIEKRGLHKPQIAAGITAPKLDANGKPALDNNGRPVTVAKYTGMHALRHFFASWCINRIEDGGLGLPLKNVQERLGHSSVALTGDVYGHLFPSTDDGQALAEAERRLLSPVTAT